MHSLNQAAERFLLDQERQSDLNQRKKAYHSFFDTQWQECADGAGKKNLESGDGFADSKGLSDWVDGWVEFSWFFVKAEVLILQKAQLEECEQKRTYLSRHLPQQQTRVEELQALLYLEDGTLAPMDRGEQDYYLKLLQSQTDQLAQDTLELERIEQALPFLGDLSAQDLKLERFFCLIARGGYGRGELTFSSDIDLAYVVDLRNRTSFELLVTQGLIRRLGELFTDLPLDFASQYFELGEDLTRFHQINALHTFPAILEARVILGNPKILKVFKKQAIESCPQEKLIRFLKSEIDHLETNSLDRFQIKKGRGGLRHFQTMLWIWVVIMKPSDTSTFGLVGVLKKKNWVSEVEAESLLQAIEFYLDLRNFLGLYERFKPILTQMGEDRLVREHLVLDLYNDQVAMALLKLKNRFTTIDQWDRFRIHCTNQVEMIANKVIDKMLNRTVEVQLDNFKVVKHLGSNQVQKLLVPYDPAPWMKELQLSAFLDWDRLLELFIYIANNGNDLSPKIQVDLAMLLPKQIEAQETLPSGKVKNFIYQLFTGDYASSAVRQMMQISLPLTKEGSAQTLLGVFLPLVNQMRFLLRNLEVHQHPLCEHSMRALAQMEREIIDFKSQYPELWGFLRPEDLFALKFSVFFHDVGKVNPYKRHEDHGPKLITRLLGNLGFEMNSELLDQIRMLVAHHQSMVRFSKLSTHLDLGILKFFELAGRDPRTLVLLYLVNISDFKSVNDKFAINAGPLEEFFERTLGILEAFRHPDNHKTLNQTINEYLDQKVDEKREAVVLDMLLWQSCTINLDEAVFEPLAKIAPELQEALLDEKEELSRLVHFLSLGELDTKTLERHYVRFFTLLKSKLPREVRFRLASNFVSDWDWFFTAMPNRYLLSAEAVSISHQLMAFDDCLEQAPRFSFVKGAKGEYDSLLFYLKNDSSLQARLAYMLNSKGINIEQGKINQINYLDGSTGFAGYFQGPGNAAKDISIVEIEKTLDDLVLPDLGHPSWALKLKTHCQVQYLYEREKGYIVAETKPDRYSRKEVVCWAVRVSTIDSPYGYFKIMAAIESLGVYPLQVMITTIGNQLIDYFYVTDSDKEKLVTGDFETLLNRFLASDMKA